MKSRTDNGFSLVWVLVLSFEAILPWNSEAPLAMLTLIVSLWYEIGFMWFFCKTVSAMFALTWFLFGMDSYVILSQNLFHNTRIEMISLGYAFLCIDDRIELVRHDRSPSYAYILCSSTLKVTKNDKYWMSRLKNCDLGEKKKTLYTLFRLLYKRVGPSIFFSFSQILALQCANEWWYNNYNNNNNNKYQHLYSGFCQRMQSAATHYYNIRKIVTASVTVISLHRRVLLAKCTPYQHISHDRYLPDVLRSTKQLRLMLVSD